jgi:hypothetical protein
MGTQPPPTHPAALGAAYRDVIADRQEAHLVPQRRGPRDGEPGIQDVASVVAADDERAGMLALALVLVLVWRRIVVGWLWLAELDRCEDL